MVISVAHASTAEQRGQHHAFVEAHCADLGLQLEQGMLLAGQLPTASDVLELVFVRVGDPVQLVGGFLLLVVQLLHRVYYLPQFYGKLLLAKGNSVQLSDLLLVLLIYAFLVEAHLIDVV